MEYVKLGKSDLEVSELGFGGCPMGGHGWGHVESKDLLEAVHCALDKGVNFFDTADTYGLGESETILSHALGDRRGKVVIATKFGVRVEPGKGTRYDNSREWMSQALEGSLRRLRVDCIDLYQIHHRDGVTPIEDVIETLELERKKGKIRYYGLSNPTDDDLRVSGPGLVSCQMEFSLARRTTEPMIRRVAEEKGLGFMSWGSLGQGILSGKYDENTVFPKEDRRSRPIYVNFHGEKLKQNLRIVAEMKRISARIGKTLPEIAIRWILDYLGYGVVLVGVKRPDQILENASAFGWKLEASDVQALARISAETA